MLVKAARRSLSSNARTCAAVKSGLVDSTPRAKAAFWRTVLPATSRFVVVPVSEVGA